MYNMSHSLSVCSQSAPIGIQQEKGELLNGQLASQPRWQLNFQLDFKSFLRFCKAILVVLMYYQIIVTIV